MTYTVLLNGKIFSRCQTVEAALQVVRRISLDSSVFSPNKSGPFFDTPIVSLVCMDYYEKNEK